LRAGETQRILLVQIAVVNTADRAHGIENLVVLKETGKISLKKELGIVDGSLHSEPNQPVLMGVGEAAKQDAVDHAEDGSDAADTQGHGHDGDSELGWRVSEATECVTEILEGGF
jgi:hypothetical protein